MEEMVCTNEFENENNEVAVFDEPKKSGGAGVALAAVGVVTGLGLLGKWIYDKVTGKADLKRIAKLQKKGYTIYAPDVIIEEAEVEEN